MSIPDDVPLSTFGIFGKINLVFKFFIAIMVQVVSPLIALFSNLYVIRSFYDHGDNWWGSLYLTFLITPALIYSVKEDYLQDGHLGRKEFLAVVPGFKSSVRAYDLWQIFKGASWNTHKNVIQTLNKITLYSDGNFDSRLFTSLCESGPMLILQASIIIRLGRAPSVMSYVSLAISGFSLINFASNKWIKQHMGDDQIGNDVDYDSDNQEWKSDAFGAAKSEPTDEKLIKFYPVGVGIMRIIVCFFLTVATTVPRLFSWIFLASYMGGDVFWHGLIMMAVVWLSLKLADWLMKCFPEDRTGIYSTIVVSMLSPCTMINRAFYLLLSILTVLVHVLTLLTLYNTYLSVEGNQPVISHNPPITHCFQGSDIASLNVSSGFDFHINTTLFCQWDAGNQVVFPENCVDYHVHFCNSGMGGDGETDCPHLITVCPEGQDSYYHLRKSLIAVVCTLFVALLADLARMRLFLNRPVQPLIRKKRISIDPKGLKDLHEIAEILVSKGARIRQTDRDGLSLIKMACQTFPELRQLILNKVRSSLGFCEDDDTVLIALHQMDTLLLLLQGYPKKDQVQVELTIQEPSRNAVELVLKVGDQKLLFLLQKSSCQELDEVAVTAIEWQNLPDVCKGFEKDRNAQLLFYAIQFFEEITDDGKNQESGAKCFERPSNNFAMPCFQKNYALKVEEVLEDLNLGQVMADDNNAKVKSIRYPEMPEFQFSHTQLRKYAQMGDTSDLHIYQ